MEKENNELEVEGRRLKKRVDALKNLDFQLEALEKENSQLEEENLQLRRSAENLRSAGAKAAQLEAENRELESEKNQMKRSLELLKASSKKTERLEVKLHMEIVNRLARSDTQLKCNYVYKEALFETKIQLQGCTYWTWMCLSFDFGIYYLQQIISLVSHRKFGIKHLN